MAIGKRLPLLAVLSLLFVCSGIARAQQGEGKAPKAAPYNLSFPLIVTGVIDMLYRAPTAPETGLPVVDDPKTPENEAEPVAIILKEAVANPHSGEYINEDHHRWWDGFCILQPEDDPDTADVDESLSLPMKAWLAANGPWYPQAGAPDAKTGLPAGNVWQADWVKTDEGVHHVDFIDWGDPLEGANPAAGRPCPVEVALYERLDATMTAYNTACLAYPQSADEIFGISKLGGASFTYESQFATLLTPKLSAEVWCPDGSIVGIPLEPTIGPSGRAGYASAPDGWVPKMAGEHRIWVHVSDPRVVLLGATVNDRDNVNMTAGTICEEPSRNELARSGIAGTSAFIDVLVVNPGGRKN